MMRNIFIYVFFSNTCKPLLNIFGKDNSEFYLKLTNKLELYFAYFIIFRFQISRDLIPDNTLSQVEFHPFTIILQAIELHQVSTYPLNILQFRKGFWT